MTCKTGTSDMHDFYIWKNKRESKTDYMHSEKPRKCCRNQYEMILKCIKSLRKWRPSTKRAPTTSAWPAQQRQSTEVAKDTCRFFALSRSHMKCSARISSRSANMIGTGNPLTRQVSYTEQIISIQQHSWELAIRHWSAKRIFASNR